MTLRPLGWRSVRSSAVPACGATAAWLFVIGLSRSGYWENKSRDFADSRAQLCLKGDAYDRSCVADMTLHNHRIRLTQSLIGGNTSTGAPNPQSQSASIQEP